MPQLNRLLIVGNRGGSNVGQSFEDGARELGASVALLESRKAYEGPVWLRRLKWRFAGRRPVRLSEFGSLVASACAEFRPQFVLTTGLAPLDARSLKAIHGLGARCVNYSTDDPWNPVHRAPWFLDALPHYDYVFTPRRANIADLQRCCPKVSFLPFGYDPRLFYPERVSDSERETLGSDVMFAGGADKERAAWIAALAIKGFNIGLYGSYWERYRETRALTRGQAEIPLLRKVTAASRVALCLVRRANRDGHSMRTFELPAVGACMLVEKTEEHIGIFGPDGANVTYFSTATEMVDKLKWLLDNSEERDRLTFNSHKLIAEGRHTYRDRIAEIVMRLDEGLEGVERGGA